MHLCRVTTATSITASLLVFLSGGGCDPVRELLLTPVLPNPCAPSGVSQLRLRGLGDFPPAPADTAALGVGGALRLDLPRGTRVVTVEGLAAADVAALGRTAPVELADAWSAAGSHVLPVAYGPPDTFCVTAAMAYPRADHRATLLSDGSVLFSGGIDQGGFAVTALERYLPFGTDDDHHARFAPIGIGDQTATVSPRAVLGHEATRLGDGRILLSGGAPAVAGVAEGNAFEGAQLLAADGHLEGPPAILGGGPRALHAAVLLADGRVLLTGGCASLQAGRCAPGQTLASTVIYDPAMGSYASSFGLAVPRAGHRALLRDDGLVVLIGGVGEGGVALPPELYDPTEARGGTVAGPAGSVALLQSGLVVALNDAGGPSSRVTAWSARDEAPIALPELASARADVTLTPLEDGTVLLAGGGDATSLAPSSALVQVGGAITELPGFLGRRHSATLLTDGTVLLAGGTDASGAATGRAALFIRSLMGPFETPTSLAFEDASPLVPSRADRARVDAGALVLEATSTGARAPESFAVLAGPLWAGPSAAGFDLSVLVGRQSGDGEPALLFGDPGQGQAMLVRIPAGAPPQLAYVSRARPGLLGIEEATGCATLLLDDAELPVGAVAPLRLSARRGSVELFAGDRSVLRCAVDDRAPARGAIALGADHGTVRFDNLEVSR